MPPHTPPHSRLAPPLENLPFRKTLRFRFALLTGGVLLLASALLLLFLNLTFRRYLLGDVMMTTIPIPTSVASNEGNFFVDTGESIFVGGVTIVPEIALVELQQLSGIGFGLVALFGGGAVYLSAQQALAPLTTMSREAQHIGSKQLHHRLTIPRGNNELQVVATNFNQVLERLEGAFVRQGRFLDHVAHELRTPVAIMHSQLQSALTSEAQDSTAHHAALESSLTTLSRLEQVIESLLLLARVGDPTPLTAIPLLPSVEDAIAALDDLAETQRVAINLEADESPWVMGDSTLLMVLVVNLVKNGILYNHPQGRVTVKVTQSSSHAILTVADTGVGIPAAMLPRIFERFYRAEPTPRHVLGAAGLGLAIVTELLIKHHGTIEVVSDVGRGTTFTVQLPLVPPPAA